MREAEIIESLEFRNWKVELVEYPQSKQYQWASEFVKLSRSSKILWISFFYESYLGSKHGNYAVGAGEKEPYDRKMASSIAYVDRLDGVYDFLETIEDYFTEKN